MEEKDLDLCGVREGELEISTVISISSLAKEPISSAVHNLHTIQNVPSYRTKDDFIDFCQVPVTSTPLNLHKNQDVSSEQITYDLIDLGQADERILGIGIIGNLCNPIQAPLACTEDESHSKQDLLSDKLVYSQPQPGQTNEINVAYKTLFAKATTGNKAFPLGSVDSWIEELNPSGDTRVFICSQTDVTLTKLAETLSLPEIEIPTFDGSAMDWLNFIVQFK